MTVIDKDGNIVSLIQSNYSGFGSGLVPPGAGFMLHNRGALFTIEPDQPNTLEPRKRPLHTIIPAFMEKGDVRIGFGIMGGWNQAQAHAQYVANIVDYGMNIQEALEAGRFTKGSFDGSMRPSPSAPKTAGEIVRGAVLELTYTARDMAPFARDMGHVDEAGEVKPPFTWNEERRLILRSRLDAVFFHLYGVTNRDDVRHVFSTFPIVERQEIDAYGSYRSRDLCLAYISALAAGEPDAEVVL